MKTKSKPRRRPARSRAPVKTPPPPSPAAPASPLGPIMWHFQHTHPQLPNAIMNLCVVAPNIAEARGKAYLLAENFSQNVIGFIKANTPTQLPDRAA